MDQQTAIPDLDGNSANEPRQPAHRLKYIVLTYAISVLYHSPIFSFRDRFGSRAQLGASLLICLALVITTYVTFGHGIYTYGVLSKAAADYLMVFLLVAANFFLWSSAGMAWMFVPRLRAAEPGGVSAHVGNAACCEGG